MNRGERHDLFPYRPIVDRLRFRWPGGARVALWVVPNIEHQSVMPAFDVPWSGRTDYGNRVGVWRIMDTLDRFGVRGTVALNSSVCGHYPQVVQACLDRNWELMGHGVTNSDGLAEKTAEEQAEIVAATIAEIRDSTGREVAGWLGPGLRESPQTPDVLHAAGIRYVCDWVNDDLPYRFNNGLWSIPYTNDLNDMRLFRPPVLGMDEWRLLIRRAFDTLYREGADIPRVMCLALHPFVSGTAGRIGILEDVLEYICSHDLVWKATGSEIVDYYQRQEEVA